MKIVGKCNIFGKNGYINAETKFCKKCGPKANKEEHDRSL